MSAPDERGRVGSDVKVLRVELSDGTALRAPSCGDCKHFVRMPGIWSFNRCINAGLNYPSEHEYCTRWRARA